MNDIGNGAVNIKEMEAEIARLRALVLRPKRIEWKLCQSGTMLGTFSGRRYDNSEIVFYVCEEPNGYWSYKIKPINISATDFHTRESAQESCQSALEAWVWQFVEVGE